MFNKKYATHKREPFFELAKNLITHSSQERVLDIGAGDAAFAVYCQLEDMYLFEGNPENFKNLSNRFKNVKEGRLPYLPYEDAFFDVIHMSHVIEHLQPEEVYETLKEMNRCCKPGGAIVISAPLLWSGFYDDLSHIKPYPPASFVKYLSKVGATASRSLISDQFHVEKLVYRYRGFKGVYKQRRKNTLVHKVVYKIKNTLQKVENQYEKTGYTIILRKAK